MGEMGSAILWVGPAPKPALAALEAAGIRVHRAEGQKDALAALSAEGPGLLLLTLDGAQDGLALVRAARAQDLRRHLPVILIARDLSREERLAALREGVDDLLEGDDLDEEELTLRVERSLSLRARIERLVEEGEELQKLSLTDGLTQVGNHRFFQDRLKDEFRRAQRYDDPLALILVDLDHFKGVNDRYGHAAGDEVLRRVARALGKCVRETDVLARYGGEEFAVLLPKTHLAGALTVAERVWRDVSVLSFNALDGLRVTCSMGVSGFPNRSVASAEQLFRTSDEALYRAKREGRNKICLFQQVSLFGPPPSAARAS